MAGLKPRPSRKASLSSAYVAAEAATHKASPQRKIKKKEQIPRCARDDRVGADRAILKCDGGRNTADDVERTGDVTVRLCMKTRAFSRRARSADPSYLVR
jgi:hypothetical protein